MANIDFQINYLGYLIDINAIDLVLHPDKTPNLDESIRNSINHFFGIEAAHLTNEILSRYVKSSAENLYIAITPHEHQIITNILTPYKSAKKSYCLGEYLAAIELCAHIAEMLATLLNLIHPIKINNEVIDEKTQTNLFGKKFIKLNQANRVNILKAFNIIDDKKYEEFNSIRTIRNNHFHLFGHDRSNAENDAYNCFASITFLIKEILEIKINDNPPPQYTINTALKRFLTQNKN